MSGPGRYPAQSEWLDSQGRPEPVPPSVNSPQYQYQTPIYSPEYQNQAPSYSPTSPSKAQSSPEQYDPDSPSDAQDTQEQKEIKRLTSRVAVLEDQLKAKKSEIKKLSREN